MDGRPDVSATAVHEGNAIGIYNVATLDNFRRKGLGSALTFHALREGQAAGKMEARIYRAIGFGDDVAVEVYMG